MNLPAKIARRYLFAKKSTNAINLITGIAVFGIAVGTAALILVLSVFNGFEDLITGMFSQFNPDVKIVAAEGKSFEDDSLLVNDILQIGGIEYLSRTLEEVAYFKYKDQQNFGKIKGVDSNFRYVLNFDSTMREGRFQLTNRDQNLAVLGWEMRNKLGVNINDEFAGLSVFMAKKKESPLDPRPFRRQTLYPVGSFASQTEFDSQYILTSLKFAQKLMHAKNKISSIEIKLKPGHDTQRMFSLLQKAVGDKFIVKNKYQQQESFLKLMKVEKWLGFAITSLMMLLVSINMIGALWMIVLDKRRDISILRSMGMTAKSVQNIFLYLGRFLTAFGIIVGFTLALIIHYLQVTIGLIKVPGDAIITAYPSSLRVTDFLIVFLVVFIIGSLASIAPSFRAKKIDPLIREE